MALIFQKICEVPYLLPDLAPYALHRQHWLPRFQRAGPSASLDELFVISMSEYLDQLCQFTMQHTTLSIHHI